MAEGQYYVRAKGKITGPFDLPTLQKLVRRGLLSQLHEISEDRKDWAAAGEFEDLFPQRVATPAATVAETRAEPQHEIPLAAHNVYTSPSETPAALDTAVETQYFYSQNGIDVGPISLAVLRGLAQNGTLRGQDLVWTRGAQTAQMAYQLPQLASMFSRGPREPVERLTIEPLANFPDINWGPAMVFWILQFGLWVPLGIMCGIYGETLAERNPNAKAVILAWLVALFLAALASQILSIILWMMLHYRCWDVLPESMRRTTPGKAVGFLFIPFFNLGWVFISFPGLASDLNDYITRHRIGQRHANAGVGIAFAVLWVCQFAMCWVPFVSAGISLASFILWFIYYSKAVQAARLIRRHRMGTALR